jgi:hypothetical protein
MSNDTHETAGTQLVQVGDVRFAYRRFGRRGGLPLLLLNYFAANTDDWDPSSRMASQPSTTLSCSTTLALGTQLEKRRRPSQR